MSYIFYFYTIGEFEFPASLLRRSINLDGPVDIFRNRKYILYNAIYKSKYDLHLKTF